MSKKLEFQTNKENLEALVTRFRMDFGEEDIKLLEYFVIHAQNNIKMMDYMDEFKGFLLEKQQKDLLGNEEQLDLFSKAGELYNLLLLKDEVDEALNGNSTIDLGKVSSQLEKVLERKMSVV